MKVLVLGSSATRDAFDYDDNNKVELVEYFARSSLASAFSQKTVTGVDLQTINSPFQRRIVQADLEKWFPEFLSSAVFDLLVYDPIDERFNLLKMPNGEICTLSNELIQTGVDKNSTGVEIITSGSDEFYRLWEQGWYALITKLDSLGKRGALRINKVFWSNQSENGESYLPTYNQRYIQAANRFLEKLYRQMAQDLPEDQFYIFQDDLLVGADMHKWGRSPFHFVEQYYKQLISKLNSEFYFRDQQTFYNDEFNKTACILLQQVKAGLLEREIAEIALVGVTNAVLIDQRGRNESMVRPESNGQVSLETDYVRAIFPVHGSTHQLKINFPWPLKLANGISVIFRLSGWTEISYLAIGHTHGKTFRHVKVTNPLQGEWVTFSVGYNDLIFGLQNGWESPEPSQINDLRLFIKGQPERSEGTIDVRWVASWLEKKEDLTKRPDIEQPLLFSRKINRESHGMLFLAIQKYFTRCNPNIKDHVENFLANGDCPLTGDTKLNWPINQPLPEKFEEVGTYRYLWHAMQPVISLMVYARNTKTIAPVFAARDFISDWLERSFFNADPDRKFTWYDHGTAERLLALLFMHELGFEHGFDYRFMSRIRLAILRHGQLLESEAFYALHQLTRYHNHAWFQDMSLIAAAIAMDDFLCAERWLECGISRLTDQVNHLIVKDNGFSIFIENSIGYHHGIQRLMEFAGELVRISGRLSDIPAVAYGLNAWSEYLRYPDNRSPSQGDTFRIPNAGGYKVRHGKAYKKPHCLVLPKAGYAVVKGNHKQVPFMLCLFATSLCKTHKHEDNLSITLFFDGIEWLIDPSFYSHEYKNEIPAYLRSAMAHNVVVIPNKNYSIEPGLASISGSSDQGTFELVGQHTAYSDYKVSRRIKGELSVLAIEGFDCAETLCGKDSVKEKTYLVFHMGEGVSVKMDGDAVMLFHDNSRYQLKLECSTNKPEVYSGWNEENCFKSVAGAGFMQINDTSSVVFQIPIGYSCQWRITVADAGEQNEKK